MSEAITAAVLVIGNEILSGRTQDANIGFLGQELNAIGIRLMEARVVADEPAEIVAAVNALRARYDFLFTTGGIGPTHDDITADSIAAAFDIGIDHHPAVYKMLKTYFEENGFEANEARMRMARIPDGATLIDNDLSLVPGFRIENVFVLAGCRRLRAPCSRAPRRRCRGAIRCCHVRSGLTSVRGPWPSRWRKFKTPTPTLKSAATRGQKKADTAPAWSRGRPTRRVSRTWPKRCSRWSRNSVAIR